MADASGEPLAAAASPASADAGRYDAFISYSRVDAAVAERICAELRTRGIETWLDIEGIVGGEVWKATIKRAIEACKAFVFLVSRDSLRSMECRAELDHAVAQHKLIVPLQCGDLDGGELPPALAALETVALRDSDPQEPGMRQLVATLEHDLPWRERHTQIAVRAREWLDADRDATFLLVGADLRRSEEWLGERGAHRQAPNAQHGEYILASLRAATVRQRRQMGAAVGALLVAAVLATVAVVARNAAVDGKRDKLSSGLAAQAATVAAQDPGLAAVLSLEAERIKPTAVALRALPGVLPKLGEALGELRGRTNFIKSVAVSPDGATIACAAFDGTLRLWDRVTHSAIGGPLRGHSGVVSSVAFSPDGRTLVSGGREDRTVRLWDVVTRRRIGAPLRAPPGQRTGIGGVAFSPDGKTIAAATSSGTVRLWDVATHRRRGVPLGEAGASRLTSVAFSGDGALLATSAADGSVRIWDIATRRREGAPIAAHAGVARVVAFAPGDRTLASGGTDGMVRIWDVATHRLDGTPLDVGVGRHQGVWSIAFAADGRALAIGATGTDVWDVATRRALGPALGAHRGEVGYGVAFSPDGGTLVTAGSTLRLWNVAGVAPLAAPVLSIETAPQTGLGPGVLFAGGVAYSHDSRTLAIVDADGTLGFWDVATRRLNGARIVLPEGRRIIRATFSPSGRLLATAGQDGAVRLWNVATRRELGAPMRGHTGLVTAIAFTSDGSLIASTGQDGTVRLWDVVRHRRSATVLGSQGPLGASIAFSPDGATLATADSHEGVRLWDVAARRPAGRPLSVGGATTFSVAFGPDGRLLATGSGDGTVRLWSSATRRPVGAPMRGSTARVSFVAFSPDGRTLASAAEDASVRLWSVASQRPVGEPLAHDRTAPVTGLAFSPDGTSLAADGTNVRLWDPLLWSDDRGAQRMRACAAGRRNLSRSEWRRYLPGEPYHETCPGA